MTSIQELDKESDFHKTYFSARYCSVHLYGSAVWNAEGSCVSRPGTVQDEPMTLYTMCSPVGMSIKLEDDDWSGVVDQDYSQLYEPCCDLGFTAHVISSSVPVRGTTAFLYDANMQMSFPIEEAVSL